MDLRDREGQRRADDEEAEARAGCTGRVRFIALCVVVAGALVVWALFFRRG